MDRKLIVTLLQKHIRELEMITEGFMEMTEYPKPIISLARQKTEDILEYIEELESIKGKRIIEEQVPVTFSPVEPEQQIEDEILSEDKHEPEEKLSFTEDKYDDFNPEETVEDDELDMEEQEEDIEDEFENQDTEIQTATDLDDEIEENVDLDFLPEINSADIEIEKTVTTTIETVIEEKISVTTSEIEINTIADTHSNKKIDDIRQAISIGDRFRFQRELFDGNGELLNKTLVNLNKMNNLEEAQAYLKKKFKWNEEDETVESFYQIIRRRYL